MSSRDMDPRDMDPRELKSAADAALEQAAVRLGEILEGLASRLDPFPAFLGMVSIQAVELEPPIKPAADRGCVVVVPNGAICELDVTAIPGVAGVAHIEQVEQFTELDLPPEEYLLYAFEAIRLLAGELERRR